MTAQRRWVAAFGILGLLGLAPSAPGQQAAPDLDSVVYQFREQIRHLGRDIEMDLGNIPESLSLVRDTKELAQALDEFRAGLGRKPSLFTLRKSYAGLDINWHHLRARLERPEVARGHILQAASRADDIDAQIHEALGLNPLPPEFYKAAEAPRGLLETRRLANALEARATELATVAEAELSRLPNSTTIIQRAVDLARAADNYHDSLTSRTTEAEAQNAFAVVAAIADGVERDLATIRPSPRLQAAWQAFAAAEVLLKEHLGLPVPPPNVTVRLKPAAGKPSPLIALTDQLERQVDALLNILRGNIGEIPDGAFVFADTERLKVDVDDFRKSLARGDRASLLAHEFRDVDDSWQRLARRINRAISAGSKIDIKPALEIGRIAGEIHRLLGLPGYPATVTAPSAKAPAAAKD